MTIDHTPADYKTGNKPCCGLLATRDIAECSRRKLYCDGDTRCAAADLAVAREFDVIERQVELRFWADALDGSWGGRLSAALRDHADLLGVAQREGWWDR